MLHIFRMQSHLICKNFILIKKELCITFTWVCVYACRCVPECVCVVCIYSSIYICDYRFVIFNYKYCLSTFSELLMIVGVIQEEILSRKQMISWTEDKLQVILAPLKAHNQRAMTQLLLQKWIIYNCG